MMCAISHKVNYFFAKESFFRRNFNLFCVRQVYYRTELTDYMKNLCGFDPVIGCKL